MDDMTATTSPTPARCARLVSLLALVLLASTAAFAEDEPEPAPMPEISRLAAWLTGDFDNWRQTGGPSEEVSKPTDRLHWTIRPVSFPGLGEHVLYAEQYEGGDPENTVQQRIYDLRPDEAEGVVKMAVFRFRDPLSVRNAHLDPGTFDGLDPSALQRYIGCDVSWRADGDAFSGSSPEAGCIVARSDDVLNIFHNRYLLDDELLVVRQWGTDGTGEPIWRSPDSAPIRLHRCRRFRGRITVAPGNDDPRVETEFVVHDQGGSWVEVDASDRATGRLVRLERLAGGNGGAPRLRLELIGPDGGEPDVIASTATDSTANEIVLAVGDTRIELSAIDRWSADLDLVTSWMSGAFSSAAQAEESETFLDTSLHVTPIWSERTDGRWLYVEQAVTEHLDRPYRQRVYRVRELGDGRFECQIHTLSEPAAAVGAWLDEDPLRDLDRTDLEERRGCSVMLQRRGDRFEGSTLGSLCTSTLRGASYATSEVVITPDGLVSWDRGFDALGNQVWGATESGYVFDRVISSERGEAVEPGPEPGPESVPESVDDAFDAPSTETGEGAPTPR
jgi:hypothetical protein